MTTPRTRAPVSTAATLVVALAALLALTGCTHAARPAADAASPLESRELSLSFVNDGRDYVHVYLVGERREWLLGRVEAGSRAALRIPDAAVAESRGGNVQLAVVTGGRLTLQAARDPRARFAIAQPAATVVSQEWRFSQGQLTALRRPGGRVEVVP
jgi:hypothetical protein